MMLQVNRKKTISASQLPRLGIRRDFFVKLYAEYGRPFPWRDEKTSPFSILVAEILLKQTRAEKVEKVWPSLVNRYPSVDDLASSNSDELFEMIVELGFGNQRTRALINLASAIKQIGGKLPAQPRELVKLPYVGIYTANAVACFAFGQRVPIVDLSIIRIISRVAGIQPSKDIRRASLIWEIAWTLLPKIKIKEHNYGLLDFAALVCKPRSPKCKQCPIATKCDYFSRKHMNDN